MDASYLSFLRTNDFRCIFRYYYGVNANTALPAHEILVLLAYVQKPPLNTLDDIFSGARGLNCGRSLHPFFVYERSKGTGKYVHFHRLT